MRMYKPALEWTKYITDDATEKFEKALGTIENNFRNNKRATTSTELNKDFGQLPISMKAPKRLRRPLTRSLASVLMLELPFWTTSLSILMPHKYYGNGMSREVRNAMGCYKGRVGYLRRPQRIDKVNTTGLVKGDILYFVPLDKSKYAFAEAIPELRKGRF